MDLLRDLSDKRIQECKRLIDHEGTVAMINYVRKETGCSLMEAKRLADHLNSLMRHS